MTRAGFFSAWKSSFFFFDALGNTRFLLSGTGSLQEHASWSGWGEPFAFTTTSPFGWKGKVGQYRDSETGLLYLNARYYSPALGRFLSRDPIGFSGGINVYAYCGGDPVNYADPSGLNGTGLGFEPDPIVQIPRVLEEVESAAQVATKTQATKAAARLGAWRAAAAFSGALTIAEGAVAVWDLWRWSQMGQTGPLMSLGVMIGDALFAEHETSPVAHANNSEQINEKEEEDNECNAMRVQLQSSPPNGTTSFTKAIPLKASQDVGVSVAQVNGAMLQLFNQRRGDYPTGEDLPFIKAMAILTKRLAQYPPNGTQDGGNIQRREWRVRRMLWRIDIENLRGHNLRR